VIELAFGAALALLAGVFINLMTERRKEINSDIESIIITSKHLANLACSYWASDDCSDSKIKEAKIVATDMELASKIERYKTIHHEFEGKISKYAMDLAMVCTEGDFQVRGRSSDLDRASKIYRTSALLNQSLLKVRDELCPRSWISMMF
tara:strand:- start:1787 stop:2236 length:450 start_codon:yes stop_codon:yes gene_type:complete